MVATGRSDYPNQINNVLAFPGVFRGLLDAQSTEITDTMLVAAARALADVVLARRARPGLHHPVGVPPGRRLRRARPRCGTRQSASLERTMQADLRRNLRAMMVTWITWSRIRSAGRLLVATPLLGDPNFKRAVVLIVEHEDERRARSAWC